MTVRDLPALNAFLNSLSAVLLVTGYVLIRRKKVDLHRRVMTSAFVTSVVFLVSYLVYHYNVGHVKFTGTGGVRTFYLALLASHTILAAVVAPLAVTVFVLARRGRFETHRRLARWTLPIWLYVSVTGVVVYLMLYRMRW
jgi:putative membrane protein